MRDPEVSKLAKQYPAWKVWRSRIGEDICGEVYATRRKILTSREVRAGLSPTLPIGHTTNHLQTLRDQLAKQAEIEADLKQSATP
jgi:hypothetical protein